MKEVEDNVEHGDTEATLALLKAGLLEAQHSIRSYDTKAQICAIGYLFSLNLVLGINNVLWPGTKAGIDVVVYGWAISIFPILLFGMVLYPTRRSIHRPDNSDSFVAERVLYVRRERHTSVDSLLDSAKCADQVQEFAFELFQSSALRDRKRSRFVRALAAAGLSLFIMFLVHLTGAI